MFRIDQTRQVGKNEKENSGDLLISIVGSADTLPELWMGRSNYHSVTDSCYCGITFSKALAPFRQYVIDRL